MRAKQRPFGPSAPLRAGCALHPWALYRTVQCPGEKGTKGSGHAWGPPPLAILVLLRQASSILEGEYGRTI
jgi:hypothetical protein